MCDWRLDWKESFKYNLSYRKLWESCCGLKLEPYSPPLDLPAQEFADHAYSAERAALSQSQQLLWVHCGADAFCSFSLSSGLMLGTIHTNFRSPQPDVQLVSMGEFALVQCGVTEGLLIDQKCAVVWRGSVVFSGTLSHSPNPGSCMYLPSSSSTVTELSILPDGTVTESWRVDLSSFGVSIDSVPTYISSEKYLLVLGVYRKSSQLYLFDRQGRTLLWQTPLPSYTIYVRMVHVLLTERFAVAILLKQFVVLDLETGAILSDTSISSYPENMTWHEKTNSMVLCGSSSRIRRLTISEDGREVKNEITGHLKAMGVHHVHEDFYVNVNHTLLWVSYKGKKLAKLDLRRELQLRNFLIFAPVVWGAWMSDGRFVFLARSGKLYNLVPLTNK